MLYYATCVYLDHVLHCHILHCSVFALSIISSLLYINAVPNRLHSRLGHYLYGCILEYNRIILSFRLLNHLIILITALNHVNLNTSISLKY
jgi:hypothetical protein